jgi:hypothetical protein
MKGFGDFGGMACRQSRVSTKKKRHRRQSIREISEMPAKVEALISDHKGPKQLARPSSRLNRLRN